MPVVHTTTCISKTSSTCRTALESLTDQEVSWNDLRALLGTHYSEVSFQACIDASRVVLIDTLRIERRDPHTAVITDSRPERARHVLHVTNSLPWTPGTVFEDIDHQFIHQVLATEDALHGAPSETVEVEAQQVAGMIRILRSELDFPVVLSFELIDAVLSCVSDVLFEDFVRSSERDNDGATEIRRLTLVDRQ